MIFKMNNLNTNKKKNNYKNEEIIISVQKRLRYERYVSDKSLFDKVKKDLVNNILNKDNNVNNLINNFNFNNKYDNIYFNRNDEFKYLDKLRSSQFEDKKFLRFFYNIRVFFDNFNFSKIVYFFISIFFIFFLQYIDLYIYPFFSNYFQIEFIDIKNKFPPFF